MTVTVRQIVDYIKQMYEILPVKVLQTINIANI